jgi:multiple RNA-binding domain-containing protein 1
LKEKSAEKAVLELDNTFLDTSKISIDIAMTKDNPELPRPWSKYSQGSSA